MSRRRFMGKRELKEYLIRITSSQNWPVPPGCKSVDVFLVGGGQGGQGGATSWAGDGGNGGYVSIIYGISVTPGNSIPVVIGTRGLGGAGNTQWNDNTGALGSLGGHSTFGNYSSSSGSRKIGGAKPVNGGTASNGADGIICPFENTGILYGASGASGGGRDGYNTFNGGIGGNTGGGNGGRAVNNSRGTDGEDGTSYGSAGGGAGKPYGISWSSIPKGGNGYQGIVILHYWAY